MAAARLSRCAGPVVADLEKEARRIIAYCGQPWDKRCLAFHETNRPIRTASATQVRRPIYNNAVGRWRVYEGADRAALDRARREGRAAPPRPGRNAAAGLTWRFASSSPASILSPE
jgi:hypothetical protein